jgi:sporulation protein YhbH
VSEESIIGQDGKKKIKIPVRGIKEYRFIYGDNTSNKKVGSAPGKDIRQGQVVGEADQQPTPGGQAGNEKGEELYEIEITLEELSHYLFNDLELPDLERKALKNIVSEKFKRHGYRSQGIRPRLDKKKTIINKIKRKKSTERAKIENPDSDAEDERFPFHENDLKYRHIKITQKESSSAVIFFLMDVSGSMTQEKKFLARSFYFLLYHFIRHRYENVEVVFVAHDTEASEVDEDKFFKRGNSGGTIVSSGLKMVNDIIDKRFHPDAWNIYVFQCSDGDNWGSDTNKTLDLAGRIKEKCQLYGYCEIEPEEERLKWQNEESRMSSIYSIFQDRKFKTVKIFGKHDIWPAFQDLLGKKKSIAMGAS